MINITDAFFPHITSEHEWKGFWAEMKVLLEPDLSKYTDEAYEADLSRLPLQRHEKAMRYRFLADRKRCVRAYMLLWEGLRQETGDDDPPLFSFREHGKPWLPCHPGLHFNLSHTGNALLCAIDRAPVGVDIEMIRPPEISLMPLFSTSEKEIILQSNDPAVSFTRLWTQKESCLKLSGQGLQDRTEMCRIPEADIDKLTFISVVSKENGFVYSICQWKTRS